MTGILLSVAVVGVALALWTALSGTSSRLAVGDVTLFRNSSVLRPAAVAVVALFLVGRPSQATGLAAISLLMLMLPTSAYGRAVEIAMTYHRPLKEASECMLRLQAEDRVHRAGMAISNWDMVAHPPFYYFRPTGPWIADPDDWLSAMSERVERTEPVMIEEHEWPSLRSHLIGIGLGQNLPVAVSVEPGVLLLLSGDYGSCTRRILRYGGGSVRLATEVDDVR